MTANHRNQETDPAEEGREQTSELLDRVELDPSPTVDGVVLGEFLGFEEDWPLVSFPGAPGPLRAVTTAPLVPEHRGRQVALMFVQGSLQQPLVIGLVQDPRTGDAMKAEIDGETVHLKGEREIRLECGKASIHLRADGKIVIKGTRLLSRATETQRIKGGSVSIN